MTSHSVEDSQTRRVFLVEDNAVVRRGIRMLVDFEPDLKVCGEAEDAEEALTQIRHLRPDIAIVDLTLKSSSGLALIPRLHAECPLLGILVLTMHEQPSLVDLSLRSGANGYLTKDESPDQLIPAIREVLKGHRFLSKQSLARMERTRKHE